MSEQEGRENIVTQVEFTNFFRGTPFDRSERTPLKGDNSAPRAFDNPSVPRLTFHAPGKLSWDRIMHN